MHARPRRAFSHSMFPGSLNVGAFADRLWGDIYFNAETRKFTRKQADPEDQRTFVHFVLDPLYKLYSQVVIHRFLSKEILTDM